MNTQQQLSVSVSEVLKQLQVTATKHFRANSLDESYDSLLAYTDVTNELNIARKRFIKDDEDIAYTLLESKIKGCANKIRKAEMINAVRKSLIKGASETINQTEKQIAELSNKLSAEKDEKKTAKLQSALDATNASLVSLQNPSQFQIDAEIKRLSTKVADKREEKKRKADKAAIDAQLTPVVDLLADFADDKRITTDFLADYRKELEGINAINKELTEEKVKTLFRRNALKMLAR